ncbi:MAG: murein transglycosylase domain-containing protein [Mariprofundales bacterium]|nr:murein transglycosylase domain-containing protein [Mariprofundales bacterium]
MKRATLLLALLLTAEGVPTSIHADAFDDATKASNDAFSQATQKTSQAFADQDATWNNYVAEQRRAFERYKAAIDAEWGGKNAKVPTKKEWVSYDKNHDSRASIDYAHGTLQVDLLLKDGEESDSQEVKKRIAQQLTNLITQPAQEDALLKVTPPLGAATAHQKVYPLQGQLQLDNGSAVTKDNASDFAHQALHHPLQEKTIDTPSGRKRMVSLSYPLPPDHIRRQAAPYLPKVREVAHRIHVSIPLVFGVIETESAFNPMARSGVPAYGLMQLVPRSGARDAYQRVYGHDRVVSASFLYDSNNNIELGATYLKLLQTREMRRITNPTSRQLCAIAAYNTGGGNVARAFIPGSRNIRKASAIINRMSPEEVYQHLRNNLPYQETRNYIQRVRNHMEHYKAWEE